MDANWGNPLHLIEAKLYRPQVGTDLIVRPQLLARLDAGLAAGQRFKLILVSAPAGFGKTTLVSQWLDGCGLPLAWVALDEEDNHLPRLLRYVCAAVRRCRPGACPTLQGLLATVHMPRLEDLADLLVEELSALPDEWILVLDDYHRIHAHEVHQLLRHLLRYLPPRLHLVILTRTDPPLLGRLRAAGQITEIRVDDLRFGAAETRRYLAGFTEQAADEELIETLHARSEGWITALQLAGISLQSQSAADFLARFGGSHRLLAGYLVEEVMAGLPAAITEFLTRTALVDRFCAPLADALLADALLADALPAGSAIIDQLLALNLFVVPLDDAGTWYRYHDLFRDFLLHQLQHQKSAAELARLHRRAGAWLAAAGLITDALRHTLAAGDTTAAADLVETNLYPLLNHGFAAPVLERWLDHFPEQVIAAHPGLLTAQCFLFTYRWDVPEIAALVARAVPLAQADSDGDDVRRRLRLAVLDILHGYALYMLGDAPAACPLLACGRANLPDLAAYTFVRVVADFYLALAYAGCGEREAAFALLAAALAEATAHDRPVMLFLLGARMMMQWHSGELAAAAAGAEQLLNLTDGAQLHPSWSGLEMVELWRGWAYYFLGAIAYERNDLAAAVQHWQVVETLRYRVNPGAYQASVIGLALVAQAQGAAAQALAYAKTARDWAVELHSPPFLAHATALELRLALAGGDLAAALRRGQEINTGSNQSHTVWLEQPRYTVVRVLLAGAAPAALATARELAATWLREAGDTHVTRQVIALLALQALLLQAGGDTAAALAALERALALGEPCGFVRSFLDLDAPMAELLALYTRQAGSIRLCPAAAGGLRRATGCRHRPGHGVPVRAPARPTAADAPRAGAAGAARPAPQRRRDGGAPRDLAQHDQETRQQHLRQAGGQQSAPGARQGPRTWPAVAARRLPLLAPRPRSLPVCVPGHARARQASLVSRPPALQKWYFSGNTNPVLSMRTTYSGTFRVISHRVRRRALVKKW